MNIDEQQSIVVYISRLLPFLKSKGVKKNPLMSFRGNRFNIIFYDAGALYYIAEHVINFLRRFGKPPINC